MSSLPRMQPGSQSSSSTINRTGQANCCRRFDTASIPASFIRAWDWTLVGVRPESAKPAVEAWGQLLLNPNADPVPTEHVSIVQHPNGGLKQIVLTANRVIAAVPPVLHYTTDTMPGSSGSPVFNDSWHVIAIHHAEAPPPPGKQSYANEGILMSAICPDAGDFWPDKRI
jgi:hypothetical protein